MNASSAGVPLSPCPVGVRIGLLLALHCLAIAMYAASERFGWFGTNLVAVYFAQPGLLAFGVVLTYRQRAFRLGLVCPGLPALLLFAQLAMGDELDSFTLAVITMVIFTCALCIAIVVRLLGYSIRLISPSELAQAPPLRFSIAQLMLATAVVAGTIALPQWVRNFGYDRFVASFFDGEMAMFVGMAVIPYGLQLVSLSAVQWLALWAALGMSRINLRLAVALAGMLFVSFMPGWYIGESLEWNLAAVFVSAGLISLLSLLFVRSCGYRFVYRSSRAAQDLQPEA